MGRVVARQFVGHCCLTGGFYVQVVNEPMGSLYVLLCGSLAAVYDEWEPNLWLNWLDTRPQGYWKWGWLATRSAIDGR